MADRDVPPTLCLESADAAPRPMDEVLAERRDQQRRRPTAERAAAKRARAGLVADLNACGCSWPLVIAPTASGHEEGCTAHHWHLRRQQQGLHDMTAAVHFARPEGGR